MRCIRTEVHVISLWSLGVWDPFIHGIQQLIFHLSHCVTVQHLHWDLRTRVSLWRNTHQSLEGRETKQKKNPRRIEGVNRSATIICEIKK